MEERVPFSLQNTCGKFVIGKKYIVSNNPARNNAIYYPAGKTLCRMAIYKLDTY